MRTLLLLAAAATIAAGCNRLPAEPNRRIPPTTVAAAPDAAAPDAAAQGAAAHGMTAQQISGALERDCLDGEPAPQATLISPNDTSLIADVIKRYDAPSLIDSLKEFYRYSYRQARMELESYTPAERIHWNPAGIEQLDESTYVAIYMSRFEQRESARLQQIVLGRQPNQQTNSHP